MVSVLEGKERCHGRDAFSPDSYPREIVYRTMSGIENDAEKKRVKCRSHFVTAGFMLVLFAVVFIETT